MSMMIQFRTDTSAFDDNRVREVRLILERVGRAIDEGIRQGNVRDSNAVVIGQWRLDDLTGAPESLRDGVFWFAAPRQE
jgi:hypothetical protein